MLHAWTLRIIKSFQKSKARLKKTDGSYDNQNVTSAYNSVLNQDWERRIWNHSHWNQHCRIYPAGIIPSRWSWTHIMWVNYPRTNVEGTAFKVVKENEKFTVMLSTICKILNTIIWLYCFAEQLQQILQNIMYTTNLQPKRRTNVVSPRPW